MSKDIYHCKNCSKSFKTVQALNAHKRAHMNYRHEPNHIKCCSILTKQEIQIYQLDKHEKAWLKNRKECPQCGDIHLKPKFCSMSCAATWNNIHFEPTRKRGPSAKPKEQKTKTKEALIVGPYSTVYMNKCAKSGKIFFAKSWRKFHPDLKESRAEYATSCKFRFGISSFPEWFDSSLIKKYGWYSTPGSRNGVKNINGVSRDHMISIAFGWENDIDPSIIRHPANCELIRHKDNQSKRHNSSIPLEKLLSRIEQFELIYPDWKMAGTAQI